MNKHSIPLRAFIPMLAIFTLGLSTLACNFINLGRQDNQFDPPAREDESFFDEDEHHDEGEPMYEEGQPHEEDESWHEEEPFHEEGESQHEEPLQIDEPHHEDECPPESECPGGPGGEPGEAEGIRADLAVTDIFPENLPHGDLKARITNHGPTPLTAYPAELFCHAHGVSWGGPAQGEEDRQEHKDVILSLGPGNTDEFETGITIDANQYQYEVVCEVWIDIDQEPGNNFYMEIVPKSNP